MSTSESIRSWGLRGLEALKLALAVSLATLVFRAGLDAILEARKHFTSPVLYALLASWPLLALLSRPSREGSWWDGIRQITDPWLGHLAGASLGREGVGLRIGEWLALKFSAHSRPVEVSGLQANQRHLRHQDLQALCWAAGFTAIFHTPFAAMAWVMSEIRPQARSMSQWLGPSAWAAFGSGLAWLVAEAFGFHLHRWPIGPKAVEGVGQFLWHISWLVPATALAALVFLRVKAFVSERAAAPATLAGLWAAAGLLVFVGLQAGGGRGLMGLGLELFPMVGTSGVGGASMIELSPRIVVVSEVVLKLVLTALFVGGGLRGGEVTPLLMCGSALGGFMAGPIGAGLGFVTLWGAVSGRAFPAVVMAWEVLGLGAGSLLTVFSAVVLARRLLGLFVDLKANS